jgi:thioredoxin 1
MSSELVSQVTDASFEVDVLQSEVPVLLDFWAVWCGPCKAIAPTLDAMASDYEGKLRIAKVDVDGNHATAMRFGVRNIPTLLLIKDGQVVDQRTGALSRTQLDDFVAKVL